MADDIINKLVQYFETIRNQTERNMTTSVPLETDQSLFQETYKYNINCTCVLPIYMVNIDQL